MTGLIAVGVVIVAIEIVSWLLLRGRKPTGLDKTADEVQATRRQR